MALLKELLFNIYFLAPLAALAAFFFSTRFNLYPVILYVSNTKGLMDEPGERRVHTNKVPPLGGLGIFITFSLTLILFVSFFDFQLSELHTLLSLMASMIILVFLGVKDDLVLMSPKKKMVAQIIAVGMVCALQDVRIESFYGVFGIGELPYWASLAFTMFVFVLIINSVNLIDGIDGLAGSIAVLASLSFGVFFLLAEDSLMILISFILIGSLLGFLTYNFSNHRKIFMGDCGSLMIGLLLAFQGITFLNLTQSTDTIIPFNNTPIILLAVLSFPLFDTARVFLVRVSQKKSPFEADSNHLHHRLLRLGLSHKQATFLLFVSNGLVILVALLIESLNLNLQLVIIALTGTFIYLIPFSKVFEEIKEPAIEEEDISKRDAIAAAANVEPLIENTLPVANLDITMDVVLNEQHVHEIKKNLVHERNHKFTRMVGKDLSNRKKSNQTGDTRTEDKSLQKNI